MKLGSIRYLITEGFKNTWVNRLMTFASVGVLMACMILIGLALVFSENISIALGNLEKQNVIMVYMKDYSWALYGEDDEPAEATSSDTADSEENSSDETEDADVEQTPAETPDENGIVASDYIIHDEDEAKALCDKISQMSNVDSVEYISSEQGLAETTDRLLGSYKEDFNFLNDEYGNPVSASARVTMKNMDNFDDTVKAIGKLEGVSNVRTFGNLADTILKLRNGITVAGFWIVAILLVISLMIVSNTIRVTMHSRKLQISIMKAVGATDSFVRIPFVVEGVLIGLVSALLAEGLIYFIYRVATESIASMLGTTSVVPFGEMWLPLLLIFVLIGMGAGALGSFFMIGKYLRKEGSEFAAI